MPVLGAQVLLDERKDRRDDLAANGLGPKLHTLVCGAGNVVLIIGGILVLLGHELKQDRENLQGGNTSKVEVRPEFGGALILGLRIVVLDADLLLTDGAPELDGKLGDILLVVLHALDSKAEKGLLHVEPHLLIVETHDAVQAAVCTLLDARLVGLSGLADNLHDVVALTLIFEVGADKLE